MQTVTVETTEGREGWEGLAMSWSVLTLQGREDLLEDKGRAFTTADRTENGG